MKNNRIENKKGVEKSRGNHINKSKNSELYREISNPITRYLEQSSINRIPFYRTKMFIIKIFSELNLINMLKIALFGTKYKYNQILDKRNKARYSISEHRCVPFIESANVSYFSSGKVIGLSKINHIVQRFLKKSQVQERLKKQIANKLQTILSTEDVAVIIEANHLCVSFRSIRDGTLATVISFLEDPLSRLLNVQNCRIT